jgi:NADH-quinone oxidoreductase subunit N
MRPLLLLPEILLFAGGLAALVGGSFLPRRRQWPSRVIALVALLAATVAAGFGLGGPLAEAFEGTFVIDTATGVARLVVTLATVLVVLLAGDELGGNARESEAYALLLFAATGALVLAGAHDLLVLAVGFLLASIPLYGIIGLARTARAAEAALKTYLIGALFGILLLLGVTLLYGLAGSTTYPEVADTLRAAPSGVVAVGTVAIIGGLMFKAGGVPAHFWVPDAAQGANATAAAFLTTVPKVGALVAVYRVVTMLGETVPAAPLVAAISVLSMTLGNFAAYWQTDPRRLLGWSTVSQLGYLLVPVAAAGHTSLALPSLLFYLTGYAATNLAAFAVTAALPDCRDLDSYTGLARRHPLLAGALVVALLGLVGTPPTAVFVGKLTTATAGWDGGYAWLALALLANSVVSLFYYLRWIVVLYQRGAPGGSPQAQDLATSITSGRVAVVASAVSLALGVGGGLVWSVIESAIAP